MPAAMGPGINDSSFSLQLPQVDFASITTKMEHTHAAIMVKSTTHPIYKYIYICSYTHAHIHIFRRTLNKGNRVGGHLREGFFATTTLGEILGYNRSKPRGASKSKRLHVGIFGVLFKDLRYDSVDSF